MNTPTTSETHNKKLTYQDAGVNIPLANNFLANLKQKAAPLPQKNVVSGIGGFCALYDLGDNRLLATGTDGVGTKLQVAQILNNHGTIGIDLVAMCVNDILCAGARPLFFLDYYSVGKLDLATSEQILAGILEGCRISSMPLIGGETAEMPGLYQGSDYDLAGFVVGEVQREQLVAGQYLQEGDVLLGLPSTGVHSNGFSLLHKIFAPDELWFWQMALQPTRIYSPLLLPLLRKFGNKIIKGLSHITGGGIENIPRMNEAFDYCLNSTTYPQLSDIAPVFTHIQQRSGLGRDELYQTFNMGVGMVLAVSGQHISLVQMELQQLGEKYFTLGKVQSGQGRCFWV